MTTTPQQERISGITQLWTEGDYRRIAALFAPVSDRLAKDLDVAGRRVLDAATGTGNTAMAMAQAGADVDAFDLTPALLDIARARAAQERLDIRFREGDLTDVPYPDATFDVVASTFGAFLSDDPAATARELLRVCRPGGCVVTTAWTGKGIIGSWGTVAMEQHPTLFEGDPVGPDRQQWSDPDQLRELFAGHDVEIRVEDRDIWFPFASAAEAFEVFATTSAPVMRLRDAIEHAGGNWDAIREDLVSLWTDWARPTAEGIELPSTYAVAFVERRA